MATIMSNEDDMKEVDFELHCPKCKHRTKETWEHPCTVCIPISARYGTCVPIEYEGPKLIEQNPGTKKLLGLVKNE